MQVYKPTLTRFANAGGLIGNSPAEVCKGNWRSINNSSYIEPNIKSSMINESVEA